MEFKVKSVFFEKGELRVEFDTPGAQFMAENPIVVAETLLSAWERDECIKLIRMMAEEASLLKSAENLLEHAKKMAN